MKKPPVFQLFGFIFWVCNVFLLSLMWGGPEAVFCDFGPVFGLIFGFFSNQKHWFLRYFVFCRTLAAIFKNAKTIVNTSVLCRPVAKNLANTTVFGRWVKKTL